MAHYFGKIMYRRLNGTVYKTFCGDVNLQTSYVQLMATFKWFKLFPQNKVPWGTTDLSMKVILKKCSRLMVNKFPMVVLSLFL